MRLFLRLQQFPVIFGPSYPILTLIRSTCNPLTGMSNVYGLPFQLPTKYIAWAGGRPRAWCRWLCGIL